MQCKASRRQHEASKLRLKPEIPGPSPPFPPRQPLFRAPRFRPRSSKVRASKVRPAPRPEIISFSFWFSSSETAGWRCWHPCNLFVGADCLLSGSLMKGKLKGAYRQPPIETAV